MTEYELADLMGAASGDSLVFIPIIVSFISAYLVVAWLIGAKLSLSQVSLVNSLFLIFAGIMGSSWLVRIELALSYQKELLAINPERAILVNAWLVPSVSVVAVLLILGCLKFMWDIRHSSSQGAL